MGPCNLYVLISLQISEKVGTNSILDLQLFSSSICLHKVKKKPNTTGYFSFTFDIDIINIFYSYLINKCDL